MNNETFLIEDSDLDFAKEICKYIEDPSLRERAVANTIGANIAKKYFENQNIDTESGLHNIAQVLEDIEIADIYVNNSHIGVRLYFDESEMCVPKSHFDNNILPLAYMFIQIDSELSGGTVTGFITPSQINKENLSNGYYKVEEDELISYYDVEPLLVHEDDEDLPANFNAQVFKYLDNRLEDKTSFYQILVHSKEGRERLIKAANAQNIFRFVSITKPNTETNQAETSLTEENAVLQQDDDVFSLEADDSDNTLEEFGEENSLVEDLPTGDSLESIDEIGSLEEVEPLEQDDLAPVSSDTSDDAIEFDEENSSLNEIDGPEILMEENDTEPTTVDYTIAETDTDATITPLEIVEDSEIIEAPIEDYVPENQVLEAGDSTEPLEIIEDETKDTVVEDMNETSAQNEVEKVQYSTTTTPSINSVEDVPAEDNDLESMLDATDEISEATTEEHKEANPQIDQLFGEEQPAEEAAEEEELTNFAPKKQKSSFLPILGVVAVIAAAGYFGYNKYVQSQSMPAQPSPETSMVTPKPKKQPKKVEDAMPVETVENVETTKTEEGNAVSIPAIEQNLDASILVSNLAVSWEVPAGYVSNNTAKRYFTKLGKIIQLNLKTELLLLSKPPITNRISVELEFNKSTQRFAIKGITASSGEKVVDDVITRTVQSALDLNLNTNMSAFGNIQGNPVLMIRL